MKPYLILTFLLCLFTGMARSAVVSGVVYNIASGSPVGGQKVYILDSNTSMFDSSVTNSIGGYIDSIPSGTPIGHRIVVSTTACGVTYKNTYTYTGANITSNFSFYCRVYLSGTVTNGTSGLPVAGQKVFVSNGIGFKDSAVTNASGYYVDSLPAIPNPDSLYVQVTACSALYQNMHLYTGSNIVSNFTVCPPNYQLHGSIILSGIINSGPAMVYLIRKQYDSVLKDTILTAIDSIATNGGTYSKNYSAIPNGVLLIKAALKNGNSKYSNFLPTYDTNAIVWSNARLFTASHFQFSVTTNFNMTAGINPGGAGFIGGSVRVGANKNAAVGDPLSNRVLLLTTSAGQAVAYTYSSSNGQFSFPNIAFGTYKIYGDAWGKANPALTITITTYKPSLGNIVFEENNKKFEGFLAGVGVNAVSALKNIIVYPNPVTDHVEVGGLDAINGNKVLLLSDLSGALISRQLVAPGVPANIGTAKLAAGMYLLQVQTEEGNASFKIVK